MNELTNIYRINNIEFKTITILNLTKKLLYSRNKLQMIMNLLKWR